MTFELLARVHKELSLTGHAFYETILSISELVNRKVQIIRLHWQASTLLQHIDDVTAKVGEPAVMRATLKARDGYRILKHYNNRVIQLSSFDDGVVFEQRMVPATLDKETLIFEVPLHPTKAGKHPINGVIRVGYIHGTDEMAMVSLRLIANVTGIE